MDLIVQMLRLLLLQNEFFLLLLILSWLLIFDFKLFIVVYLAVYSYLKLNVFRLSCFCMLLFFCIILTDSLGEFSFVETKKKKIIFVILAKDSSKTNMKLKHMKATVSSNRK